MEEIWKPVPEFEDLYMVSSTGRVKSLYTNEIRKPYIDKRGYYFVILFKDKIRLTKCVHRLVAQAFISNPNNYPCVDHIDTNPSNNNVNNLQWCTHKMNCNNPITLQRNRERHWTTRNNPSISKSIVRISQNGETKIYPSQSEAQRDGFRQNKICECCLGKRISHKGYKWMYLSDYENLKSAMS